MKKNEEKRLAAEKYIAFELLKLNSGEFLPSRRNMEAISGLGRNIIANALADKIASGQIIPIPRRGYCKAALQTSGTLINIHNTSLTSNYYRELVDKLSEGGTARNETTHLGFNELPINGADAAEFIRKHNFTRVFLVAEENSERLRFLREQHIPAVAILPRFVRNLGGSVRTSPKLIDMQLERLFSRGCRRIAYINHLGQTPENYSFLRRRESFYRWMAERGHRVYPHHVCSSSGSEAEFQNSLAAMFDTFPPPDAVICCTYRIQELYQFLRSRSLRPMFDVIISADGMPERMPRPLPHLISNDPAEVAKLGWILMDRFCAGLPGADDVLLPQWFFTDM